MISSDYILRCTKGTHTHTPATALDKHYDGHASVVVYTVVKTIVHTVVQTVIYRLRWSRLSSSIHSSKDSRIHSSKDSSIHTTVVTPPSTPPLHNAYTSAGQTSGTPTPAYTLISSAEGRQAMRWDQQVVERPCAGAPLRLYYCVYYYCLYFCVYYYCLYYCLNYCLYYCVDYYCLYY